MKGEKNALEWTVFAVSIVLILLTVVYLVRDRASGRPRAPEIEVSTGPAVHSAGMWSVPVKVTNRGDETAEQLRVDVSLEQDGRETEKAELTFAFVPRRSSREAWALFRTDPRAMKISARATSYERP
jgi:uncharacterized protein (TIGR02588 family)